MVALLWPRSEARVDAPPPLSTTQTPLREAVISLPKTAPALSEETTSSTPARFEGEVVDSDQVPLPDAELEFEKDGERATVHTDSQGRFIFDAEDGEWRIERVWAPGHVAREDNATYFAAEGTVVGGLRFELEASRVIRGTVSTNAGRPVEGAELTFTPDLGDEFGFALGSAGVVGRSDVAGRFSVEISIKPRFKKSVLSISHECCLPHKEAILEGATDVELTIHLNEVTLVSHTFSGVVVDEADHPVVGATVHASAWPELEDGGRLYRDRRLASGEGGQFSVTLPGTTVRLFATLDSRESEVVEIAEGTVAKLVLQPRDGAISGRVIDEAGRPVTKFFIQVRAGRSMESWTSAVTGDGRFRVAGLLPGPKELTVETLEFVEPPARHLEVEAGTELRGVECVLTRGRTLKGRVIDAKSSKPLAMAGVSSSGKSEFTNNDGTFELAALPETMIDLNASHEGYADRIIQVPATSPGPVTIQLRRLEQADAGYTRDYEGIGVMLDYEEIPDGGSGYRVINLHPEGGARVAGLQFGDEVLLAEGQSPASMDFDQFNSLIKGPEGTTVRLTIRRDGRVFDLAIARRRLTW